MIPFGKEPVMRMMKTMMKTMMTTPIMIGLFSLQSLGISSMVTRKGICHVQKGICFFSLKTKYLDYEDFEIAPSGAFYIDH